MLQTPTLEKLEQLKFTGMLKALQQQQDMPELRKMSFDERFGLLVDSEFLERDNARVSKRLHSAKLKQQGDVSNLVEI